ncbi:hypothetical protein [Allorhodopirellula solitaria]|uniref:hypothetical protein n=1 Tax=Allorhodopirellula solitaria TaxID=2527987 RepID=UPI001FEA46F2|nr:hypothetical protein [Allorhodopirellula solitaria]
MLVAYDGPSPFATRLFGHADRGLFGTAGLDVPADRARTPAGIPPILIRLGLDRATWCELVSDFGRLFCCVAGRPECVDSMRCHRTHRRYHLRRSARELLTTD